MSEKLTATELVQDILNNPAQIDKCYTFFHNYSILNSLALAFQIQKRGLPIGPVASFKKWKELGSKIKKGEKALSICIPLTIKSDRTRTVQKDGKEVEEPVVFTAFSWKNVVFTLAQTDGKAVPDTPKCKWDYVKACRNLKVNILNFDNINGNIMGYATKDGIAINPLNKHKIRTAVHELAHTLLHKKANNNALAEVEAELVSYIMGLVLKLDGAEESRGYIKHWLGNNELKEKTAMKALCIANKIYAAGRF